MAARIATTVSFLLTLGLTLMVFADPETVRDDLKDVPAAERHKRSDDFGTLEVVVSNQAQKIASLEAQMTAFLNQHGSLGSTYVRWGRSQCPNTAQLVYNGVVGAHKYNEQGGGTNRLCLVHTPEFDQAAPLNGYYSVVHGTEWYVPGHDHTDVPCAVCQVPQTKVIMVPGTKTCPSGWTSQYTGHLTATYTGYTTSSEFLCADENHEDIEGTGASLSDGSFFMFSIASCGSLPCPPYTNGKVLTCVVCSK